MTRPQRTSRPWSVIARSLSHIEPDEPEQMVPADARVEVGHHPRLAGHLADGGLREEDGIRGEGAHLVDRGPEHLPEPAAPLFVVAVDARPGDVTPPGPVRAQRPPRWDAAAHRPQPSDVVRAARAED